MRYQYRKCFYFRKDLLSSGAGGKKVLCYFIFIFSCPSSLTHYIVGLITGGLELVWSSGEISI